MDKEGRFPPQNDLSKVEELEVLSVQIIDRATNSAKAFAVMIGFESLSLPIPKKEGETKDATINLNLQGLSQPKPGVPRELKMALYLNEDEWKKLKHKFNVGDKVKLAINEGKLALELVD